VPRISVKWSLSKVLNVTYNIYSSIKFHERHVTPIREPRRDCWLTLARSHKPRYILTHREAALTLLQLQFPIATEEQPDTSRNFLRYLIAEPRLPRMKSDYKIASYVSYVFPHQNKYVIYHVISYKKQSRVEIPIVEFITQCIIQLGKIHERERNEPVSKIERLSRETSYSILILIDLYTYMFPIIDDARFRL